ncbi:hypothetical protein Tco_0950868, partial [Tanacetum coccineum]
MRQTLADRLSMVYTRDEGQELFTSHACRRLSKITTPLVREFILKFLSTCRMRDMEMGLDVADTLCFQLGGGRHLRRYAEGRKSGARLSEGYFIGRLVDYIGLDSRYDDTWAWVASGPERQQAVAAGAPAAAEGAHAADEGAQ